MLNSNEILLLIDLSDKMNEQELRDTLVLLTNNLIKLKEKEYLNPIFAVKQGKEKTTRSV